VYSGHVSIFNGTDLTGWKSEKNAWQVRGEKLTPTGKSDITTEKAYGSIELIFDWKRPATSDGKYQIKIANLTFDQSEKPGAWHRALVTFRTDTPAPITFPAADGLEIMNVFVRELKPKE
jgi:hypothetical protein